MRQMKGSGTKRIGDIPEMWETCPLKYVSTLYTGNSIKDDDKNNYEDPDNAVPYLSSKDIDSSLQAANYNNGMYIKKDDDSFKIAPEGSTLMCIEGGSAGKKKTLLFQDVAFVNKLCCFRPDAINGKFLFYSLCSPSFEDEFKQSISGLIGGVSVSILKNFRVVLPSLKEQQAIATVLDYKCAAINGIISKMKSSVEEYRKLKQAIITQAVTKGVRENRPMNDSGIEWVKEIPSDWSVIPAKYLFKNSDVRKQDGDEQMTASQQFGIISQEQYMKLTGSKVVLANKGIDDWKHVEPFDFIISLRSFQGGLEMSETTGCITWHYIVLKPCKEIYSYYFKWLFKSELYIKALQRTCNFIRDGQDLRYSNFIQVPLFEPSLEEQKEIANYLNVKCAEIDKIIAKKKDLLAALESYKKSMIYEYVTGKKEVSLL